MQIVLLSDHAVDQPDGDESGLHGTPPSDVLIANNTGTYDLGLIYMNARYYLPEVGRFISPDTLVPDPGNPQSHNRYAYVLNSPVNYTDPSGHLWSHKRSAWSSISAIISGNDE